jgi:hypothetical protein
MESPFSQCSLFQVSLLNAVAGRSSIGARGEHNNVDGLNVSFKAKYVSAEDMATEGLIPTAPVLKADRSPLFKGDDLSSLPLEIHCGFQEN